METLLFVTGLAIIANTIYGLVLWARTMPPGARRTANLTGAAVISVLMFPLTALVMLGYVPWYHARSR